MTATAEGALEVARERVTALMTIEEKNRTTQKAASVGVSVSELIRRSVISFDPVDTELEPTLRDMAEELDRVNAIAAASISGALRDLALLNEELHKQNKTR